MALHWDKFLLFGDSITEYSFNQDQGFGSGAALSAAYARRLQVINRGLSGYNSEHGRYLINHILDAEHIPGKSEVKLMYIFFGTNDASNMGIQRIPLERYVENIRYIAKAAIDRGIKTILITPGLHDEEILRRLPDFVTPWSSNSATFHYAEGIEKLGEELNLPVVNNWKLSQKDSGYSAEDIINEKVQGFEKYLIDGIHYTAAGYKLFYGELLAVIKQWYPELAPANIRPILPYYRNIDPANVGGSISKYQHLG